MSFWFGKNGGVTTEEIAKMAERDQISDFLPWVAHGEEDHVWLNADNTVGYIWECSPLIFSGEATGNTLGGLFRVDLPESAVAQFIFYADPDISDDIEWFKQSKRRTEGVLGRTLENLSRHYVESDNIAGIPLRKFRLFFTVKMPIEEAAKRKMKTLRTDIQEVLRGAWLHPRPLPVGEFLRWMRGIFNDEPGRVHEYDPGVPLRKQVVWDTVRKDFNSIRSGSKVFRCITPKTFPREMDTLDVNRLFGGIDGPPTDPDQIGAPFLCSLTILFKSQKNKLHAKCSFVLQQQAVGSFAPSLMRRKEEYMWAVDELERGVKFFRVIPTMWILGRDEEDASTATARARRLWEDQNFVMQDDKGIVLPLFLASLPFGLYDVGNNIDILDRDHTLQVPAITTFAPIQGDFAGSGDPVMPLIGRKGQLAGVDIFSKRANNHNFMICAESGGGKSFFTNYLIYCYYTAGAKVRVIDIGGSYRKASLLFGAKYMDFSPESHICLNPFTNIVDPDYDVPVIAPVLAQMAYSSSNQTPTETELTLLKDAARWAYENEGGWANIDTPLAYLNDLRSYRDDVTDDTVNDARRLAFNMRKFSSVGEFGRFFNGPSTFNIADDNFTVLELEHLKPIKELFKVITLQVINATTQDIYLSDRGDRRFVIFDEAWQFLGDSSHMREVIEEGYRRARKYNSAFGIITQSILDRKKFGAVGDAIYNSSAFKFYLESKDFDKARAENLIEYDGIMFDILKSTKSKRPAYSEIFMDTPFGAGVARLSVDPFSYYVFTSDADEISEIERMVLGGMNYEEAIHAMVAKYKKAA